VNYEQESGRFGFDLGGSDGAPAGFSGRFIYAVK
jgi:hypothetical protein